MIFDADAKRLITLDDKAKTYTETTTTDMAAATAQRKEQMAAAMSKMPPERRKAMESRRLLQRDELCADGRQEQLAGGQRVRARTGLPSLADCVR